jgi:hypothetical protein
MASLCVYSWFYGISIDSANTRTHGLLTPDRKKTETGVRDAYACNAMRDYSALYSAHRLVALPDSDVIFSTCN